MPDESTEVSGGREPISAKVPVSPGYRKSAPSSAPSSSRMVAAYLADIEQLLDAHRAEPALREALDLPRIAAALADAELRCTQESVNRWCEQWIRPPGAERDTHGLEYERLSATIVQKLAQTSEPDGVPMRALRRLQLRRHARTAPRGFEARRSPNLSARESESFDLCVALIEAARRWYARNACHDPTVQANLARLAVLR